MSTIRIAFGGSAADPLHKGHLAALKAVRTSGRFDLVYWYPSGYSPFKPDLTDPVHRSNMTTLAVPKDWYTDPRDGGCRLIVDISAIYQRDIPTFLRMLALKEAYRKQGIEAEVTFFTGSDAVTADQSGEFPISRWAYGPELVKSNILLLPRVGFAQPEDTVLPGNFSWLNCVLPEIASSDIRAQIGSGKSGWKQLVANQYVARYIELNHIYEVDQ